MTETEARDLLKETGYEPSMVRVFADGRIAWIHRLLYTWAILVVEAEDLSLGHDDRWCYTSPQLAEKALAEWDGPEPLGWIRHPSSGRRRENGETAKEYINR